MANKSHLLKVTVQPSLKTLAATLKPQMNWLQRHSFSQQKQWLNANPHSCNLLNCSPIQSCSDIKLKSPPCINEIAFDISGQFVCIRNSYIVAKII